MKVLSNCLNRRKDPRERVERSTDHLPRSQCGSDEEGGRVLLRSSEPQLDPPPVTRVNVKPNRKIQTSFPKIKRYYRDRLRPGR